MTPVLNFLKAHFSNLRLELLEIAQKPNRTLKFVFSSPDKKSEIIFKCFPHGQHLILSSGDKGVNSPWRPRADWADDELTFVEPEAAAGWALNDDLAAQLLDRPKGPPEKAGKALEPYHEKLIKRVEKALRGIEEGAGQGRERDEARVRELEEQAAELKGKAGFDSRELQALYDEIKKIKRKAFQNATRRNELLVQLEKLKTEGAAMTTAAAPRPAGSARDSRSQNEDTKFSGTRVRLEPPFEFWVGRTAWQNDDLVRQAGPHELWIHLRDYPGAHGVIRSPKKSEPSQGIIDFCCQIVAYFSQSKKKPFSDGEKLDFIVTPRKFVKKPKGEAPGRVIVEREMVRRVAFKTVKFEVI